jgi:hypothetical protein
LIPLAIQTRIANQYHLNLPFVLIPFHFSYYIATTVAKYHLHTTLIIDTTVTKHHSYTWSPSSQCQVSIYALSHPRHSAKYHCNVSLATDTMVTNYLSFFLQSPSHCVYPIHTEVCKIIMSIPKLSWLIRYIINLIRNNVHKVLIFVQTLS